MARSRSQQKSVLTVGPAERRLLPRLGSREASGKDGRWVGGEAGGRLGLGKGLEGEPEAEVDTESREG